MNHAGLLVLQYTISNINLCQYGVVQYMMKHQKYMPVSRCRVDDEISEICDSI